MQKYSLEFVLHMYTPSQKTIMNSLAEFGEGMEIVQGATGAGTQGKDFKISLRTEDPTLIFDVCADLGRITSIKIHEEGR